MAKDEEGKMKLAYTIFCDDVRLEVGNKLSLMGVFHQILVQHFPVTVMKFAVVTQWRGEGRHLSEVSSGAGRPWGSTWRSVSSCSSARVESMRVWTR